MLHTKQIGTCPISGTGTNVFKITPEINRFICFCAECKKLPKAGGDCIEMVRRYRRVDYKEAAAAIQNHMKKHIGAGQADANAPAKQEVSQERKAPGFDPLRYLATLDAEHESLASI